MKLRGFALAALVGALVACTEKHDRAPAEASAVPARASSATAPPLAGPRLRVPRVAAPPKLDGELDEWEAAARSGAFLASDGSAARPFSEVRFMWDDENLYVALYAADENIETRVTQHDAPVWTDDAFRVRIGPNDARDRPYAIDVSATGVVADASTFSNGKVDPSWESKLALGIDRDGTPNDPSDDDEEWVIEGALPFSSLGVSPRAGLVLAVGVGRCDTPKSGHRACGVFGLSDSGTPESSLELVSELRAP